MTTKDPVGAIYRDAARAVLLGLVVNLSLGLVKLIGGLVSGAFALIADAVNSLGDTLTSIVVLAALWVARRPADKEHPYGHSRAEAIAGSNVALVVIISAMVVGWEAIRRMSAPHAAPPVWTLWIAGANVVIKESLYRYKARVGRRTGSMAVIANAWDHRSDALCSLAVLIGLTIVRWAGPTFFWADEAAALVVAGAIILSGAILFRRSASELMDLQADEGFVRQIREAAESVDGVLAVEKLWVRKTGLEYLADIHVEVDPNVTVARGHLLGHDVKDLLVDRFASLRDVLVHLEPYPVQERPDDESIGRPRSDATAPREAPPDPVEARRGDQALRVLVADDNSVNQVLVTRILEKKGHRVTVVDNGEEVLESFATTSFDLILMDVQMPRKDGLETTAAIRAKEADAGSRVPIIALTAQAADEDSQRCLEAGMDAHISKPIDARELLDVIDRLVHTTGGSQASAPNLEDANDADSVFDCNAALMAVAGDVDLLSELASVFLGDCPLLLADVKSAVDRRDARALEESAARFQDALSCLSASRASTALQRVAEAVGNADAAKQYDGLAREVAELTSRLKRLFGLANT